MDPNVVWNLAQNSVKNSNKIGKNSKVFEQKGNLLNLSQAEPS